VVRIQGDGLGLQGIYFRRPDNGAVATPKFDDKTRCPRIDLRTGEDGFRDREGRKARRASRGDPIDITFASTAVPAGNDPKFANVNKPALHIYRERIETASGIRIE
jgi:hypothetical protein